MALRGRLSRQCGLGHPRCCCLVFCSEAGSEELHSWREEKETGTHDNSRDDPKSLFRFKCWRNAAQEDSKPRMDEYGSISALLGALKACSCCGELELGKRVHFYVTEAGKHEDIHVVNTLISMYAKCGSLLDAQNVFDKMHSRDLVSWNALIQGYAANGEGKTALDLFSRMSSEGCEPDARSFVAAAVACSSLAAREAGKQGVDGRIVKTKCLKKGMEIHSEAAKNGFMSNIFVASALVEMYSKCGSLSDARLVFDSMKARNVITWTSLIMGYVDNGYSNLVLGLFERMQKEICSPNSRTYVAAIMACASLAEKEVGAAKHWYLDRGSAIHAQVRKSGFSSDVFVASALVDMYAKCGSLRDAINVFDSSIQRRDVVLWNALILGFVDNEHYESALEYFSSMEAAGFEADARTYVAALRACSTLAEKEEDVRFGKQKWLKKGRALHAEAAKKGYDASDEFVASSLVDMYSRCGSLTEARCVFDKTQRCDLVLWNSLILGYLQNGEADAALQFFARMQSEGYQPDARTFVAALMACSITISTAAANKKERLQIMEKGMEIHQRASESGLESDIFVASSLVEMYAKCGSLSDAQIVFDRLKNHDVVLWTCLIMGYAENGEGETALQLLKVMLSRGCEPNSRTFVAALIAAGETTQVEIGREIHSEICRRGLDSDDYVGNSLLDFFGKCGRLADAERVFDSIPKRRLVAWSSLISAHCRKGNSAQVFELFQEMQRQSDGFQVDGVTLLSVLTTCSHAGLVEEGKKIFKEMLPRYGVEAEIEHFHCVIDMFGRANLLEEALEAVRKMPFEASCVTWKTLLAACRQWQNVEIGRVAFVNLLEMDERDESACVLMSNLYGSLGMWEEQLKILEIKHKMRTIVAD